MRFVNVLHISIFKKTRQFGDKSCLILAVAKIKRGNWHTAKTCGLDPRISKPIGTIDAQTCWQIFVKYIKTTITIISWYYIIIFFGNILMERKFRKIVRVFWDCLSFFWIERVYVTTSSPYFNIAFLIDRGMFMKNFSSLFSFLRQWR